MAIEDNEIETPEDIMETKNIVGVIKYISEHPNAMSKDVQGAIPNWYRMKNTVKEMIRLGIVEEKFERSPRPTYRYTLTEKGEKIAKRLREIDEIIKS